MLLKFVLKTIFFSKKELLGPKIQSNTKLSPIVETLKILLNNIQLNNCHLVKENLFLKHSHLNDVLTLRHYNDNVGLFCFYCTNPTLSLDIYFEGIHKKSLNYVAG
jgi:hypothetical protein